MTAPFRDEEASALARVEELEVENERLREEIEHLRDRVGENRDAYVANIEGQLKAVRLELAEIKAQGTTKSVWWPQPEPRTDTRLTFAAVGVFMIVAALVAFLAR